MVAEDFPIKFKEVGIDDEKGFRNFFMNSFMHYYLNHYNKGLSPDVRRDLATTKADFIARNCKFLIGMDNGVDNIYYSYIAYSVFDNNAFLYMAYVKREFRGFGLFRMGVEIIKEKAQNYYYALPLSSKRASIFHDFKYGGCL